MRMKKNGVPAMAVIIPTGSSTGEITVLAMVSATTIKVAPVTIDIGINAL